MNSRCSASLLATAMIVVLSSGFSRAEPYLIVGNDEKLLWDDKGAPVVHPAGKDSVVILDLANPENPKVIASSAAKKLGGWASGQSRH